MARRREMKFKTGNICRIYIKNFLTFNEVEVRTKPKLNFICGANGTGKSTVLCALCLCLGGKVSIMGRGKQVYDYIKQGEEEAVVEVEVFVENRSNDVIKYIINKAKNTSQWYLQGHQVTNKAVMARMEKLNIQVDNLCQFLPQDRVVAFAKMDCQELLMATEKAVGDPSLFEQHNTLCSSGRELTTMEDETKNLKTHITQTERKIARLKDVVDNITLKEKLEEEVKELTVQRSWCVYDHQRKVHIEKKDQLHKREKEYSALMNQMAPQLSKIKVMNEVLHRFTKVIKEKKEFVEKRQKDDAFKAKYDKHTDKAKEAKRTFLSQSLMEQQRQTEVKDYQRQLEMLLGQLHNLPDLDEKEVKRRLGELTEKIHRSSQETVQLQSKMAEVIASKEHKNSCIRSTVKELSLLQDVMGQRLELLKRQNKDAYKGTKWLEDNGHIFKGLVYPPICTLINVSSQEYTRHVENRVMERDLVAFVCEDKDDVNKLKDEMDRLNTKINIVHANPNLLGKYRPAHPIRDLRKYGFTTYMLDCIEAPPAVLSFLCQSYSIHSVPLGSSGDYTAVPPSISVFYFGSNRYTRSVSRYDGQVSTSIIPIGGTKLLHIIRDHTRIEQLQQKMCQLNQGVKEDEEEVRGIKAQENELSKDLEVWRNEKRSLSSRNEDRQMLRERVRQKKEQLHKRQEEAVDLEAAKETMTTTILGSIKGSVRGIQQQLQAIEKDMVQAVCRHMEVEGKVRVVRTQIRGLDGEIKNWKKDQETTEGDIANLKEELERQKLEGRSTLNDLKRMLGIVSVNQITAEVREKFQNASLEDTEHRLAEKDAHLACLTTATAGEVSEYQEAVREMERLQKALKKTQQMQSRFNVDLEAAKERWLPQISQLVSSINDRFSVFMSRMGYAGEVTLQEEGNDFSRYGMAIRVKFRDQQRLQQLTAQRQSGGERAVSTALYLLALQSQTSAPFRCVDEINQGMDKVNERKMLEMLMETEANENCSQYFFVTPKLLQGIQYNEKVNIMSVYNSPLTLSHRRFTIKRILKRKEEQAKQRGHRVC